MFAQMKGRGSGGPDTGSPATHRKLYALAFLALAVFVAGMFLLRHLRS